MSQDEKYVYHITKQESSIILGALAAVIEGFDAQNIAEDNEHRVEVVAAFDEFIQQYLNQSEGISNEEE